ncbi:MAG: hypothetical protein ACYC26_14840 [Phycisphaerales bacterium]
MTNDECRNGRTPCGVHSSLDIRHSFVIRHSSFVISSAMLLIACLLTMSAQAQLDMTGPSLPGWFFNDRLSQLDQRIAAKAQRAERADAGDSAVIESQKKLLLIARYLLTAGRDAGEQGHLTTLYGLTIADGAADFDAMTDALPDQVNNALKAKGDGAQKRVEELAEVVQAIRRFNDTPSPGDEKAGRLPESATAAQLDAYLRKQLEPLLPVAQKTGGKESGWRVRSTWAVMQPTGGAGPPHLKQHLEQMDKRLGGSKIDTQAGTRIHHMIGLMGEAAGYADMRPRIASLARQVERLIDAADKLSQLNWLDEQAKARIGKEIQTTATLMMDPDTRPAAMEHIEHMEQLCQPAAMLDALARIENMPLDNPRKLFAAILALEGDEQQAKTVEAVTTWLGRLTKVLLDHYQPGGAPGTVPGAVGQLPLDVRKVMAQLQQQYDTVEKQTLDMLPLLAASPQQVTQPRWTEALTRMTTLTQQMNHLAKIPDWAKRMNRINPASVRGLYKQYLLIAQDLLKPATADGATTALAEMDRQLALFEHMPGEDLLSTTDPDLIKLLGDRRAMLWQQLIVLRSQWAAAWGAGLDPTPVGRKLLLMRRLMNDLITAAKLPAVKDAATKLNRWAAWQAPTEAWMPVQAWLINQLQLAQQQAGADQWDELDKTLDRADAAAAALGLVADLSQRLDPAMDRNGEGFPAMLSQCLFSPGKHAMAGDHREDLAKFCVYLTAAADANANHPDQRQTMSRIVGDLAIPLRAALAGTSEGEPASNE